MTKTCNMPTWNLQSTIWSKFHLKIHHTQEINFMCVLNLIRETKQNLINEWENDILEWTCLEKKILKNKWFCQARIYFLLACVFVLSFCPLEEWHLSHIPFTFLFLFLFFLFWGREYSLHLPSFFFLVENIPFTLVAKSNG